MTSNLIKFLTCIRNASLSKKSIVKTKNLKNFSLYIAILYKEGYIQSFFIDKNLITGEETLIVYLRFLENKVMTNNLRLISTLNRTKILSHLELAQSNLKHKLVVLSTSQGILSHTTCLEKRLGGVGIFSC